MRMLGADRAFGPRRAAEPSLGRWAASRSSGRSGAHRLSDSTEQTSTEAIRKLGRLVERWDPVPQEPSESTIKKIELECT